jgi:hypothetical protein
MAAPLLFGLGMIAAFVYQRWLARNNEDWFVVLGALAVGVFWLSVLLTGLSGSSAWSVGAALDTGSRVLAVCYALAYPFWFWVGGQLVFVFFGRRPDQGGVIWLYRIDDRTEEFDPPWET